MSQGTPNKKELVMANAVKRQTVIEALDEGVALAQRRQASKVPGRVEVERFLAKTSPFQIGEVRRFADGSFHIANGAEVVIVGRDLDHTHVPGHTAECFSADRIEFTVVSGQRNGEVGLRFQARAKDLRQRA
jgi:hypothetical protein